MSELPASPWSQREVRALQRQVRFGLRAMLIAGLLFLAAFAVGAYQVNRALDGVEAERAERINAQSSINAYFCRELDKVGKGVGGLVAFALANPTLTPDQRRGYARYLAEQKRPPRCHAVALKLAVLTGADPGDVVLVPLRIHSPTD